MICLKRSVSASHQGNVIHCVIPSRYARIARREFKGPMRFGSPKNVLIISSTELSILIIPSRRLRSLSLCNSSKPRNRTCLGPDAHGCILGADVGLLFARAELKSVCAKKAARSTVTVLVDAGARQEQLRNRFRVFECSLFCSDGDQFLHSLLSLVTVDVPFG